MEISAKLEPMNFTIKKSLFKHLANPLHIYCRIVEYGVKPRRARKLVRLYENLYREAGDYMKIFLALVGICAFYYAIGTIALNVNFY